jgi:NADH-quinone oxidoreductase subunit N
MAAAVFLYGFALLYGATGSTQLRDIHATFAHSGVSDLALLGLVLAIVGVCFKIAAVPMHAYTADVYQGAATPVTAFLAFVPKAAGFVTLIILLMLVGWPLSDIDNGHALMWLLWSLAVITMFFGNTAALLQTNVKRVLAYSSIAHSGYMLVGLTVGVGSTGDPIIRNGLAALLFYLVAYGVMNVGAFAVIGVLKRRGEDAETFEDLHGLSRRNPAMAAVLALCVLSLAGVPPLVGFWGKFFLVGAAITGGFPWLAVIVVINSAIAAAYYLRIIRAAYLVEPTPDSAVEFAPRPWRGLSAGLAGIIVLLLSLFAWPLADQANRATPAEPSGAMQRGETPTTDQLAQRSPSFNRVSN